MTSLETLLKEGTKVLEQHKIQEARLDAWLLLEYVTGMNRAFYFAHSADGIEEEKADRYRELIRKRAGHIPLQHITHQAYFMGFEFYVNQNVLVPRQDTETLVEEALKVIEPGMKVLDLCTGSGCIIISILHNIMNVEGDAVDISRQALNVAIENAKLNDVVVNFERSDLFDNVTGTYDVIVSNPPYIVREVMETLDPEVREHEPALALDGGEDGLSFYRRIVKEAGAYLCRDGLLAFEIGYDQGDALRKLLSENGYGRVEIIRDLAGLDRVALGWKKQSE